jgi:Uma2 family endonuclease
MSSAALPVRQAPPETLPELYRFSVLQYLAMVEAGVFATENRVELIEGWVVKKMSRRPTHDSTLSRANRRLARLLPEIWVLRCQMALVLARSVPEPDLAIVDGPEETYDLRHPSAADAALAIEVAESSLHYDRQEKGPLYAEARIAEYWIINVVDLQVEVYTQPRAGKAPEYRKRQDYSRRTSVPVILGGKEIGRLDVAALFTSRSAR